MSPDLYEGLLKAKEEHALSALEESLLDSFIKLRKIVVRATDRHPVLTRDWNRDGEPIVRCCSCSDCLALRKAVVGIFE